MVKQNSIRIEIIDTVKNISNYVKNNYCNGDKIQLWHIL